MGESIEKIRFFIRLKHKEYAKQAKKKLKKLMGKKVVIFLDKNSMHQIGETDQHTYETTFGVKVELRTATNKNAQGVKYWIATSYAKLPEELKSMVDFVEIDRPLSVDIP